MSKGRLGRLSESAGRSLSERFMRCCHRIPLRYQSRTAIQQRITGDPRRSWRDLFAFRKEILSCLNSNKSSSEPTRFSDTLPLRCYVPASPTSATEPSRVRSHPRSEASPPSKSKPSIIWNWPRKARSRRRRLQPPPSGGSPSIPPAGAAMPEMPAATSSRGSPAG